MKYTNQWLTATLFAILHANSLSYFLNNDRTSPKLGIEFHSDIERYYNLSSKAANRLQNGYKYNGISEEDNFNRGL